MKARKHVWVVLVGVLAGAIALLSCIPVMAQEGDEEPAERKVNLNFKDAPIDDVIEALFANTGLNFALAPGVKEAVPAEGVTITLTDRTFDEALKALLRTYSLSYRVEGGVYIIEPKSASTVTALRS